MRVRSILSLSRCSHCSSPHQSPVSSHHFTSLHLNLNWEKRGASRSPDFFKIQGLPTHAVLEKRPPFSNRNSVAIPVKFNSVKRYFMKMVRTYNFSYVSIFSEILYKVTQPFYFIPLPFSCAEEQQPSPSSAQSVSVAKVAAL